jgi:hypothetical protein
MSPADVIALRKPKLLRPHPRRRPKAVAGEVELFRKLDRWRIPYDYESIFFPLEFHQETGEIREGFQPDGLLRATRRHLECFIEVGLGGWSCSERRLVDQVGYQRMLKEKRRRIQKLLDYYGLRTVLIDGPLYDRIVNLPGGRQQLYAAIDAVFAPIPEVASVA